MIQCTFRTGRLCWPAAVCLACSIVSVCGTVVGADDFQEADLSAEGSFATETTDPASSSGGQDLSSARPLSETDADISGAVNDRLPEGNRAVRKLILRLKPDIDEQTLKIWAEQFRGLSDGEIEFLVSQSVLLFRESRIPDGSQQEDRFRSQTGTTAGGSTASLPFSAGFSEPGRFSISSSKLARDNLAGAMTVGYRQQLLLDLKHPGGGRRLVQEFDFTAGPVVITGNPLHLALCTSGPLFFALEDGGLTRCGMFVRLADGRLGWEHEGAVKALRDSPVVEAETPFTVDSCGRVEDGRGCVVGQISVVRVRNPADLRTHDGVHFTVCGPTSVVPAVDVQVRQGAVELSNVDIERNRWLAAEGPEAFSPAGTAGLFRLQQSPEQRSGF